MRPFLRITVTAVLLPACGPSGPSGPSDADGDKTSEVQSAGPGGSDPTPTSSTVTTVTTGSVSTSVTSEESAGFVTSGGTPDSPRACDPFAQDCKVGEKCSPVHDGDGSVEAKCIPVRGTGVADEPCLTSDGTDDCALGYICWNTNDSGEGACVALCTGNGGDPMCPAGFRCSSTSDSGVTWLCLHECDPLLQDCPEGESCRLVGTPFVCVLDASGEDGQINDSCESDKDCDPGLTCRHSEIVSAACKESLLCCTPYCELPDGACPNADEECYPWSPPGYENTGFCGLPR
jgi:hypothetical protein